MSVSAPRSWRELSQPQLEYIMKLLAMGWRSDRVKVCAMLRFAGITVVERRAALFLCYVRAGRFRMRHFFHMAVWQVEDMARQLDFIDAPEADFAGLDGIGRLRAVDSRLHGVSFIDYLGAEGCYQRFLLSQDTSHVDAMARILYRKKGGKAARRVRLQPWQAVATVMWWMAVKTEFNLRFPHFFKPAPGAGEDFDVMASINTQIRALTGGDVAKEKTIYEIDCWRALTELDAKAREAIEFEQRYGK